MNNTRFYQKVKLVGSFNKSKMANENKKWKRELTKKSFQNNPTSVSGSQWSMTSFKTQSVRGLTPLRLSCSTGGLEFQIGILH